MNAAAIILARGGSKGVPQKNVIPFCGKPLLAWTIQACKGAGLDTYVSTDCSSIREAALQEEAFVIDRPTSLATDSATSESGWIHALDILSTQKKEFDWVVAPQVTSPFTSSDDIKLGLEMASSGKYDSLFSASVFDDLMVWKDGKSVNYNSDSRGRRQQSSDTYIENGAFYIFTPQLIRTTNNRMGQEIGMVPMDPWKIFEIDTLEDVRVCSTLMKEFLLDE